MGGCSKLFVVSAIREVGKPREKEVSKVLDLGNADAHVFASYVDAWRELHISLSTRGVRGVV